MKNHVLFLALLLCTTAFSVNAQQKLNVGDTVGIWQIINFDSACSYINVDTSQQNIWQIGRPQKTIFNAARSLPNAMVTDTVNNYPVNNYSHFDLYVGNFNVNEYPYDIFFDFWHKYDTDTLKDGGYITVSWDEGLTWMNIIRDSVYQGLPPYYSYYVTTPNMYQLTDTLYNGEYGFSGNSNGWIHTTIAWCMLPSKMNFPPDTMIIRFNFISDSIQHPHEGWMIDNIRIFSIDLGGGIHYLYNNDLVNVSPNPVKTTTTLMFEKTYPSIDISVFDAQGKLWRQNAYSDCNRIIFDRKGLNSGLYYLKITFDHQNTQTKKIIITN
jgi:hypothetical protein